VENRKQQKFDEFIKSPLARKYLFNKN